MLNSIFQHINAGYFLNILAYIIALLLLISILILFKKNNDSNKLSMVGIVSTLRFYTTLAILSLSGVPPFIGFFAKFFFLMFICLKSYMFTLVLFLTVNIFILYFYLQQLRYLDTDEVKKDIRFVLANPS